MSEVMPTEGEHEIPERTMEQLGLSRKEEGVPVCESVSFDEVERAVVFNKVLSTEECHNIIDSLNNEDRWHSADSTSTSGLVTYRVSDRMMFLSHELSDEIVARTGLLTDKGLPPNLSIMKVRKRGKQDLATEFIHDVVGTEGDWECVRINPCFRVLRYGHGGHFLPHCDGSTVLGEEKSFATIIIYLNDNFSGGSTKLFVDSNMEAGADETRCEVAKVIPVPGKCLLFYHDIVHSGEEVNPSKDIEEDDALFNEQESSSSYKYIIRTELMYRRIATEDRASGDGGEEGYDEEGVHLLREAEKLESNGNYQGAIQLYNRLRYKYPDIAEAAGI